MVPEGACHWSPIGNLCSASSIRQFFVFHNVVWMIRESGRACLTGSCSLSAGFCVGSVRIPARSSVRVSWGSRPCQSCECLSKLPSELRLDQRFGAGRTRGPRPFSCNVWRSAYALTIRMHVGCREATALSDAAGCLILGASPRAFGVDPHVHIGGRMAERRATQRRAVPPPG